MKSITKTELKKWLRNYSHVVMDALPEETLKYSRNLSKKNINYILDKNPHLIETLDNPTDEQCWLVLNKSRENIKYIKNPSIDMVTYVLQKCPEYFNLIKNKTESVVECGIKYGIIYAVKYIKNQTEETCLELISRWWWRPPYCGHYTVLYHDPSPNEILSFFKNPSTKVLIALIEKCPDIYSAIVDSIPDISDDVHLYAIKYDPTRIKYIKNQTEEVCLAAVKQNGLVLEYIKNQTEEVCLAAVKQNSKAIRFVKNQTEEVCLAAVNKDHTSIDFVNDITDTLKTAFLMSELRFYSYDDMNKYKKLYPHINKLSYDDQLKVVQNNPYILKFVEKQTNEICECAIKSKYDTIRLIENPSDYICKYAIDINPDAIKYIDDEHQTEDICIYAVRKDPCVLKYVKNQTKAICFEALKSCEHRHFFEDDDELDLYYVLKMIKDPSIIF